MSLEGRKLVSMFFFTRAKMGSRLSDSSGNPTSLINSIFLVHWALGIDVTDSFGIGIYSGSIFQQYFVLLSACVLTLADNVVQCAFFLMSSMMQSGLRSFSFKFFFIIRFPGVLPCALLFPFFFVVSCIFNVRKIVSWAVHLGFRIHRVHETTKVLWLALYQMWHDDEASFDRDVMLLSDLIYFYNSIRLLVTSSQLMSVSVNVLIAALTGCNWSTSIKATSI